MLVKAKSLTKNKLEPIQARANNKDVKPVRCTTGGELMVHQTNQPLPVGHGVNQKNKDGVLILGDDGESLRNLRVNPDGTLVVHQYGPVDIVQRVVEVEGTVCVSNEVAIKPVTVANMPQSITVQEPLRVTQEPIVAKIAAIDFEGYESVILNEPARIYQIHLTVYDPTMVEVVGVTGSMYTNKIDVDLFPLYVQVKDLKVKVCEFSQVGGYVVYGA